MRFTVLFEEAKTGATIGIDFECLRCGAEVES